MTVAELITRLSEIDPELQVWVPDPGCGCCSEGTIPLNPADINVTEPYEDQPAKAIIGY